ncbi:hypothetical protein LV476_03425 [Guyparkeria hydrothermalis]|uniref:hypothetical protein n=1 Tax=Guyparkeria hydrothermalis TaxID=923 RepID=UPI002020DACD|nr:hypothetical protein [Guyparkeria hydrothermalis]MCL7744003.1 hypothetical protein [Guyparkeria hydrothermalis]
MPNKEFLENSPLYRKWPISKIPHTADQLPKPNINMACQKCDSHQTFVMTNTPSEGESYGNYPTSGLIYRARYLCVHCQHYERHFLIKIATDRQSATKVGQYPPWEITGNKEIERLLGEHSGYYKKGLICESQGFGIAAFGYYRRIVEEIIDGLLQEVAELLAEEELRTYELALEKTKKTTVTQEKIQLVKDLLPPILRPDGMNPLQALHSALSEGLHAESDQKCLEYAQAVREVLLFLVSQIAASRKSAREFTSSMRKLLEKRATS